MANIFDDLKSQLTSFGISRLSAALGENEASVQKGIDTVAPAFLAKAFSSAGSPSGASRLLEIVNSYTGSTGASTNITDVLSGLSSPQSEGGLQSLLAPLLGDSAKFMDSLSSSAGISRGLVSRIIGLIAPLFFGKLRSMLSGSSDPRSALMSLASSQLGSLRSAIPSNVASSLGIAEPAAGAAAEHRDYTSTRVPPSVERSSRSSWGIPALLALALALAGAWWLMRSDRPADVAQRPRESARASLGRPPGEDRAMKTVRLPNGQELSVHEGTFIDTFAAALAKPGPSDRPVSFDQVTFDRSSTSVAPQSAQQLEQFSQVLKGYPAVRIKISGFTEIQGSDADNRSLSLARANSVKQELVNRGIDAQRIETEGRGAESPIATNDTEEGRAANRRIEVVILQH